jgi:uncharacterized protein (DUF58 family)
MLKNKLRYLFLVAVIGLLSILYNQYYMGIIFLSVATMPFLLFGLLCYLYRNVSAELVSTVHVVSKGEVIPISVQLNNPTIFPITNLRIYLTYKNSFSAFKYKKDILVSIDRKTETKVVCNMLSEYAGNMEVSIQGIRIYDYLRLFSLKKKITGEMKMAVLPNYHELPDNQIVNRNRCMVESDSYSQVKSGDDPSEVFSIREYREGDRLQRIHWKLSKKQNQLMIKEFSDPLNCSVLLYVNFCIPEGEDVLSFMDALLECALSLSYTFLLKGQIHYFSWFDESHGVCRRIRVAQEKDLFEAVDGLLQAHPFSAEVDAISAYLAEHPNDQYTDLFYITGEISEPRLDSLSILKAITKQMIYVSDLINIGKDQYIPVELVKRSDEMGIGLFTVDIGNVRRDMELLRLG